MKHNVHMRADNYLAITDMAETNAVATMNHDLRFSKGLRLAPRFVLFFLEEPNNAM